VALIEGLAAVVAKIVGAGVVTQVTAGVGIAVVGLTGAGAAGVLPGAVQDTVAAAVETVSPFDLPDSGDVRKPEPQAWWGPVWQSTELAGNPPRHKAPPATEIEAPAGKRR